jgi:hypothetical protein
MRCERQPVATNGNGFGLYSPLLRPGDLPVIAAGCARWVPQRLHARLSAMATRAALSPTACRALVRQLPSEPTASIEWSEGSACITSYTSGATAELKIGNYIEQAMQPAKEGTPV